MTHEIPARVERLDALTPPGLAPRYTWIHTQYWDGLKTTIFNIQVALFVDFLRKGGRVR